MDLIAAGVVKASGDRTLLLTHYLLGGTALGEGAAGIGKLLKSTHAKRSAARALRVPEAEAPVELDDPTFFVEVLFPSDAGFSVEALAVKRPLLEELGAAYVRVGRESCAAAVSRWLRGTEEALTAYTLECRQLAEQSTRPDETLQALSGLVGGDVKLRLREGEGSRRPRLLLHVGDAALRPEYYTVISGSANRARQVADILERSGDLRKKWDEVCGSRDLG